MFFNYGSSDKIICINTKGEEAILKLGETYTCRDIWRCGSHVFTIVEELPVTNPSPQLALMLAFGAICPECNRPVTQYWVFEASRFIKKPEVTDLEKQDETVKIETPITITAL